MDQFLLSAALASGYLYFMSCFIFIGYWGKVDIYVVQTTIPVVAIRVGIAKLLRLQVFGNYGGLHAWGLLSSLFLLCITYGHKFSLESRTQY